MTEDPAIRALFGKPPAHIDLAASEVHVNNGAVIAMLCLAAMAVVLRFAGRIVLRSSVMADDWAIIAALASIGVTSGISIAGGNVGSGKHIWAVSLEDLIELFKLLYSYTFVYALSCTCGRLSILLFYWRVFWPMERPLKVAVMLGAFVTASYPIIVWVTMLSSCQPISFFWSQFRGAKGKCIDVNAFFLAAGIVNMVNDFFILAIPFPRIIKLQMTVRKKVAICAVLAVGFFVCISSIVRIYVLTEFMKTTDVTWLMGPVFIWSTIEPSVAIVCSCLPHLAPLARLAHRSIFSTLQSQKTSTAASGRLGMGQGQRRSIRFGARGPTFDGFDEMKNNNDDEIGLTNYVAAERNVAKHSSIESFPGGPGSPDNLIAVQSTFVVQSTSPRRDL